MSKAKLTEDDLFVAITNWCEIDPSAEDYEAMQRVKGFLETQMRVMRSRRQQAKEAKLAKAVRA